MTLEGFWTDRLRPSRVDGFIDPSFSGVFGFHAPEDVDGNLVPNLQIGDRMLSIAGTWNVSFTAPRVPIPPPVDAPPPDTPSLRRPISGFVLRHQQRRRVVHTQR